jgi:hypothetical protein
MILDFDLITLVYAKPKYVAVIMKCQCLCGHKITKLKCPRYGTINIICSSCREEKSVRLDRTAVYNFVHKNFPTLTGDLNYFLDTWEIDMQKS